MTNEVKTCEVVVELPTLTKGYHYTGEYRKLVAGDSYGVVDNFGPSIITITRSTADKHHVVKKDRWVPKHDDIVWYVSDILEVKSTKWRCAPTCTANLFKTEAIAEIARSNIHALLTEADLNNM
jgi:hypothetical protein